MYSIYTDIAISAAITAGREIQKIYNDVKADLSVETKADNSPLTIADKTSHRIIMHHLKETGWPVLSEEGRSIPFSERRSWKTLWLVDPLDGTKEFIKRNGEFTVNIALVKNGKPITGIIYLPVTLTLYVGVEGEGAWKLREASQKVTFSEVKKEGKKLPCTILPENYTIVGSRSHESAETKEYISKKKKEYPRINMVSKGSSLKICMVAEDAAHEYPRFGPTMEWDTAAGHAIANAAGKKLWHTDFSGELTYNKENLLNPFFIVK